MASCFIRTLISLILVLPYVVHTAQNSLWTRQSAQDNTIFSDNFLWETETRSKLDCVRSCADDDKCTSLTSTAVTSESVTCRGHSQVMTSGGTSKTETKYYRKAPTYYLGSSWLTKECAQDNICNRPDAQCYKNRCLCTPGYYYAIGQDSCQKSCNSLQEDFVEYPWSMVNYNNVNKSLIALDKCKEWCLSMDQCLTIEYNYALGYCFVATITAQDVSSSLWTTPNNNMSYFQRACS